MQRKASAVWKGGLKDGKGVVSVRQRRVVQYSVLVCNPF